jgi:hypothetical protein
MTGIIYRQTKRDDRAVALEHWYQDWAPEHAGSRRLVSERRKESGLVRHLPLRSAQLVFGRSFYRQGSSGQTSSADEFLDAALTWFGDPDPRLGTAWEKAKDWRSSSHIAETLLVLDGLEPLQNPPGPQEGRLREPSLQALLSRACGFQYGALPDYGYRSLILQITAHLGSSS